MQAILRAHPASATDKDEMGGTALGLLRGAVQADPWKNPASWPAWRQLLPHVLAVNDAGYDLDPAGVDGAWLLDRAATYLQTRGEPGPARHLFERAFNLYCRVLGEDHPDTLNSAASFAVNLYMLGKHEQAPRVHEDTLTRRRRVLGDDHPNTLNSAQDLAVDLSALGDHERARQLDEDTLTRRRRVLGTTRSA